MEAEAYRDAELARGEGDAEASSIYAAAFDKDREFYSFTRSLKAYENAFSGPRGRAGARSEERLLPLPQRLRRPALARIRSRRAL